ncbi:LytTR family DNA-binding domain-containing protein [Streptococcus ruminantium]|uniref:LytTR family DNA-binding domain-containing protein n=1 Tax=Streptococcus ruminantium TaxID=1917441 RepID=UPI0012DCCE7C|nr:LytTR family DNA-binding domain-containing protein [Streptococcus ruminantium]
MKSIIVQIKQETTKVMMKDIYSIMSCPIKPHYVQMITEEKTYELLQQLQNIEKLYPEDLLRCHRNCLVNISKMKAVNFQEKPFILRRKDSIKSFFRDVARTIAE